MMRNRSLVSGFLLSGTVTLNGAGFGTEVRLYSDATRTQLVASVNSDPKSGHYLVETVVDPLFFQQLGIDQVPAVAWLDGVQSLAHCDQEDYSKATVVYGAISIEAALKEVRKAGASVPESVIAKYRGSGWERKP